MTNTLLSVQILPKTADGKDVIPLVDEAIRVIDASGVTYEVHPLETTMEGNLNDLLRTIEKMNERMVELGCPNVISQIKILYQPAGITMNQLTEKYR
ncbi:MTH1187 family thiamine-binding protein [Camelliibacillus cellulosilyticus]|uniref:MTH1187 family thiamine-binding protein n=1 Tax=Camelliibacillus cellulosilyticus TaxID=2174486 RepID=A0ABV9GLW9_9BACL